METTLVMARVSTHVNGWAVAVYMSNMCQNFRLFLIEFIRAELPFLFAYVTEAAGMLRQRP